MVNFSVSNIRDILVWIILILLWLIIKSPNNKTKRRLFALGFLSGFQYFISLDRAYFLTFLTFFLAIIFLFFSPKKTSNKKNLKYVFGFNKAQIKNSCVLTVSFFLGFFFQLPLVGFKSFNEFIKIAFWQIPRMVGNFHEQKFLLISEHSTLARGLVFWLPVFLLILNGFFVVNKIILPFIRKVIIKKKDYILTYKNFYLLILYVFSVVFFRGALVTVGLYHLNYGSTITFLVTFIITEQLFFRAKKLFRKPDYYLTTKYFFALVLLLIILFNYSLPMNYEIKQLTWDSSQCAFHPQKEGYNWFTAYFGWLIFCPPYQSPENIKRFLEMPKKPDEEWVPELTLKAIFYINSNTTENDYVFVFSNESIYYYFLKAKSPTRFAGIWFADTNFFREEVLADLKKNPPKYIIYSGGASPEVQAGISMADRFKEINEWILGNYPKRITFSSIVILYK